MTEIVNCPFCGGVATVGGLVPWVECQSCGASGPQKTTDEEAIAAWNHRHSGGDGEDAARYRWLREHVTDRFVRNNEHEPCLLLPHNVDYLSPDEIDAAIDEARAGERGSL